MKEEVQLILSIAEEQMNKTIAHTEAELLMIRAGKANPHMLDGIMVDYYGVISPLNQVSNINTPDSHTLAIQPWDKSMIEPIEKAILLANLGLNPQNDGSIIRINIPTLTEARRLELVKQAKSETENCKLSIRNFRREANEEIKAMIKTGLEEDLAKDAEEKIQELTNSYISKIDHHLAVKEKEILTI